MRDSRSVDFERDRDGPGAGAGDEDVIHATAGSPTVISGANTPGMLTPKELVVDVSPGGGGGVEHNPFGEFNSVTRDVGGW